MTREKRTILLIEDDTDLRDSLIDILEDEYFILTASDGSTALETLEKDGQPDLIILDMMMPRMNGFEFLREFREVSEPECPILLISAFREVAQLAQVFGLPYLLKPLRGDQLRATIKKLLLPIHDPEPGPESKQTA